MSPCWHQTHVDSSCSTALFRSALSPSPVFCYLTLALFIHNHVARSHCDCCPWGSIKGEVQRSRSRNAEIGRPTDMAYSQPMRRRYTAWMTPARLRRSVVTSALQAERTEVTAEDGQHVETGTDVYTWWARGFYPAQIVQRQCKTLSFGRSLCSRFCLMSDPNRSRKLRRTVTWRAAHLFNVARFGCTRPARKRVALSGINRSKY